MADEQSTGKSFFTTLPGIITAIAGLITAVGGFILILNKTGCIGAKADETGQHVKVETGKDSTDDKKKITRAENQLLNTGNVVFEPDSIRHITRQLVYKVVKANAEILPNDEVILNVKLKCINKSDYEYHFYQHYLGAIVNGDNYGPDPYSPSGNYQSIPPRGFKNLEYNFRLPRLTKQFKFEVYEAQDFVGSSTCTIK